MLYSHRGHDRTRVKEHSGGPLETRMCLDRAERNMQGHDLFHLFLDPGPPFSTKGYILTERLKMRIIQLFHLDLYDSVKTSSPITLRREQDIIKENDGDILVYTTLFKADLKARTISLLYVGQKKTLSFYNFHSYLRHLQCFPRREFQFGWNWSLNGPINMPDR